jgi:MYND finger
VERKKKKKRELVLLLMCCKAAFLDYQIKKLFPQQGDRSVSSVGLLMNADFEFLQMIAINTKEEPVFFRALALITIGVVFFGSVDAQGYALVHFDEAFAAIEALSDLEKQQTVRIIVENDDVCTTVTTTVGAILSRLQEEFVGVFQSMAECRIVSLTPTGAQMPVAIMAGLRCECCEKPRGESVFMVCERCSLAHYCSVQCQRKAWKEHGHKMVCRKEGEFRVGDVAGSTDPFGSFGNCHMVRLKGHVVQHRDGDDDDDNHSSNQSWHVESTLEKDGNGVKLTKIIPSAILVCIRPGLWNALSPSEWDTVRREHLIYSSDV